MNGSIFMPAPVLTRLLRTAALGLLLAVVLRPTPGAAQALLPGVDLTRPNAAAANRLDLLRTPEVRVALLHSQFTPELVPDAAQTIQEAVRQWELLLLGLDLPYRILDDRELARGVPDDIRLLILPAAEALSGEQRKAVLRFVQRGGGLLASGRTGLYDQQGRNENPAFFRELFGAELVPGLPEQPSGILQGLDGGHPLTAGLPMGYRLNLAPQTPVAAVRPVQTTGVGRPYPYTYRIDQTEPDPFALVTLLLYGRHGEGRVTWMRFNPQDVSRETEQQAVYQGLILNTLAYLAGVPQIALRPWPNGHPSASVFAALPVIENPADFKTGTTHALDALEAAGAPGTFFVTTDEAALFPDLTRRIARLGEVALSADTDDVLKTEPLETQLARLQAAHTALDTLVDQPLLGLYPPGGFYDLNTIRVMQQTGLRYLLLTSTFQSAAPRFLDWYGDVDFREPLFAHADADTAAALAALDPADHLFTFSATGRDDYTILSVFNLSQDPTAQFNAYRDDFAKVHRGQGLYLLPYHTELQALTPERAAVLRQVAELASAEGSWMTTLRDAYRWWLQHEQMTVSLVESSDRALTFEVVNGSPEPITGASFDVWLPTPARAVNAANARATLGPGGRTVTVVVPTLTPGSNRVTLAFSEQR